MLGFIFLLLLALPLAELYVIVQVADGIGFLNTIVVLIVVSIAGAWLLKREGVATWRRFNEQLAGGKVPAKEVTDGAMIMFGGALLLTPGFLTDVVGLVFVLPPTRALIKGLFRKAAGGWAVKRMGPAGYAGYKVYETTATRAGRKGGAGTDDLSSPGSPRTPAERSSKPLPARPEDDSPGTG